MLNAFTKFLFTSTPLLYLTQSLWRDEAFSVWIAQDSLTQVIERTSGDFNPPLYYLFLHFWMQIFGRSEIALRSLSLVFFALFLFVVYKFALLLFKTRAFAKITVMFMALNPMLLYFAFELRMYSLLVLWTTLSMYFYYCQKWHGYVIVSVLGMYTQPFMAFVILAQSVYLLVTRNFKQALVNGAGIILLYSPWLPTLLNQFKASGPMWMYPIDTITTTSILGNVFFGYEGTPGNLWGLMQLFSLGFVLICVWLMRQKRLRPQFRLLATWVFVPLVTVLLISLVKPIYVHRYVIFTSVGEVFILLLFLNQLNIRFQKYLVVACLGILVAINLAVTSFHRKVNLRPVFEKIQSQLTPADMVVAETPLVYYEALYYTPAATEVYLYNPLSITPPRYVGSGGMPPVRWLKDYPRLPQRAFVISENGSYQVKSTGN